MIADRYRLIAKLGSGGFGKVWKAHDVELGIEVLMYGILLTLYTRPPVNVHRAAVSSRPTGGC